MRLSCQDVRWLLLEECGTVGRFTPKNQRQPPEGMRHTDTAIVAMKQQDDRFR